MDLETPSCAGWSDCLYSLKWSDFLFLDANDLSFTTITQILAGSDMFPANGARCRIEQRYGCLEQLRFVKRDHVLTIAA